MSEDIEASIAKRIDIVGNSGVMEGVPTRSGWRWEVMVELPKEIEKGKR